MAARRHSRHPILHPTVEVRALDGSLPGACVPVVERVKGPADLLESGDCTLSFMGEEYELEAEDGWFYPKGGSPCDRVVVPNQADPSTVLIITYEPVASVLAWYDVEDWSLESLLGWQAQPLFGVKVRVLKVDLDVDSGNTAGTELPPRTPEVDATEGMGGFGHPGKIVYMNDMDVDGDQIPDFLDGFVNISGCLVNSNTLERSDNLITGGAFIPIVLDCPLPEGVAPADARIEFVYDANNPGAIDRMTLAASQAYATNAWQQNTLPGRIRVWTKNANVNRKPASVASGGDFVPSGTLLPYGDVVTGGATQTVFYVEGIGTSPAWGGDTIKVRVYPSGAGQGWGEDQVSYTVVRCVYKVCVYRPYICQRNASGTITNRAIFRSVVTSPRTMLQSYFTGMKQFDDYDAADFHQTAAFMGHAFARVETRMPDATNFFWTGQTGLYASFQQVKSVAAFQNGTHWWFRSNDGREDKESDCKTRYQHLFASPVSNAWLSDAGAPLRKMVAVREFRLRPETVRLLSDYRSRLHPFKGYGLDVALKTSSDSRIGCGSYVGLLTEYSNVCDIAPWVRNLNMPVVNIDGSVHYNWIMLVNAFVPYTYGSNGQLHDFFATLEGETMPAFTADPASAHWGASPATTPYRNLMFCDPELMMDWVDAANAATAWDAERGVTVKWNATNPNSLTEWRSRP